MLCLLQIGEPVSVLAFTTEGAIEALDGGVVCRFAGRNTHRPSITRADLHNPCNGGHFRDTECLPIQSPPWVQNAFLWTVSGEPSFNSPPEC